MLGLVPQARMRIVTPRSKEMSLFEGRLDQLPDVGK